MSVADTLQTKIQKEVVALSDSISDLVKSFRKLRSPLAESQEKVPQATNQLDKVTEQTEAAAHKMLDVVEEITEREGDIIKSLEEIRKSVEDGQTDGITDRIDSIIEKANANLNDAFTIMDALQFQDITAQQMDHAAHLLEDVEGKLTGILSVLGVRNEEGPEKPVEKRKRERAFDPHADFVDKKTDQRDIDSLFDETGKS